MSDQLTAEQIAAGEHGVPSFADTIHKLIDRVLPNHTWEGQLAHESVDAAYPEEAKAAAEAAAAAAPTAPVDARDTRIAELEAQVATAKAQAAKDALAASPTVTDYNPPTVVDVSGDTTQDAGLPGQQS